MALNRTSLFRLQGATLADGLDVWSMIQEIGPGENGFHNEGFSVPFSRFREFLHRVEDARHGRGLPHGYVPQTTFWAYLGSRPVGISKLRHCLTDALRSTGGHIGYAVRPSERGRGYGTLLLHHTLREAEKMGIETVLITVSESNLASWRLVEANRGVLVKCCDGKRYYEVATATTVNLPDGPTYR